MFHHRRHEEEEEVPPTSDNVTGDYGSKKEDYGGDYGSQGDYGTQDNQSGYRQSNTDQGTLVDDTGGYTDQTLGEDTNQDRAEAVEKEKAKHGKFEHGAEGGTLAAGAFALYEGHEAKKDPEHAGRHRLEEEVAGVATAGGAGLGVYEHHEKKKSGDEEEEFEGKKKHGWFG